MAVINASKSGQSAPTSSIAVPLSTAQTGTGASTNVANRGDGPGAGALVVTTTVGATPTITFTIEGSADGTNWYAAAYSLVATPETVAVAAITITTAVTTTYLLRPDHAWDYLRLNITANTNVTITATAYL